MQTSEHDDLIIFNEEIKKDLYCIHQEPWKILIVDDEPDVHDASVFALKGLSIEGRALMFTHAYSAKDAKEILGKTTDFSVAIIDVVMEEPDSGFELIQYIREDLKNSLIRIILRTGQPGYAPEIETIKKYDINDYKTKSELTRVRLFTSVTIAIRAFALISQLENGRRGLESVLRAVRELGQPSGLQMFAAGVVTQICALLRVKEECLLCVSTGISELSAYVLAAGGQFSSLIGRPIIEIPDEHIRSRIFKSLAQKKSSFEDGVTLYFLGKSQQSLAAYLEISRPLDEVERGLLDIFCSNISTAYENLQLHLSVSELAFNDDLVKLPNRNGLMSVIDQRAEETYVIALIDIDNFADINSSLDYSFGDLVLQSVASRLRNSFPADVCVARISSDLFALFGFKSILNENDLIHLFESPFKIAESTSIRITVSSGWLLIDDCIEPAVELLKKAGSALKKAKEFNRGKFLFYDNNLTFESKKRIELLNELHIAVSKSQLTLYYQPFVEIKSRKIVGAEALLRWFKEDGTAVPPDQFISIAEQSGVIIPIGYFVLQKAMLFRKSLASIVDDNFRIAVNVSQAQFREPDFVKQLVHLGQITEVKPQWFELELTESIAAEDLEFVIDKINYLKTLGYSIALDDFGTGYSSLSLLHQLPVDRLKIDRSFVSGQNAQKYGMAFANIVIALANKMGINTIAEGIEELKQCNQLIDWGCIEGQGYLFSRPVDEYSFIRILRKS